MLTFRECDTRRCISIPISNDEAVEHSEMFVVGINATAGLDNRVRVMGATSTVQITDTDGRDLCSVDLLL